MQTKKKIFKAIIRLERCECVHGETDWMGLVCTTKQ